mmetsp:Transcript_151796/g.487087  ORF Transcript_151796/g.487087 Transcript_151796/m.487087 type:complete len:173 (+) Transcript_151796:268-786(+)
MCTTLDANSFAECICQGYFDCYSEEHALVYTQLHREFSSQLEQAIDGWLKTHDLCEDDLGSMLEQARLRGDGEGDAAVGALLGMLDYQPWIGNIFVLKRLSDEAFAAAAASSPGTEATPPLSLRVAVPEGVQPGQEVQVSTPDGQLLVVVVPEGCHTGFEFDVAYVPQVVAS